MKCVRKLLFKITYPLSSEDGVRYNQPGDLSLLFVKKEDNNIEIGWELYNGTMKVVG